MSDAAVAARATEVRWVMALGVFVGVAAVTLSLVGLLGRLSIASVLTATLAATGTAIWFARLQGPGRPPWQLWAGLPLVVPLALAALLLPPCTWDEVAYGAALPRDYARAGRFFYNSNYGPYSAFPANYEALVTASLLLTGDVRLSQVLNVVLVLGMAVSATLIARNIQATRSMSLVAGLFCLTAPALIAVTPLSKNDVAAAFFQVLSVLALLQDVHGDRRQGVVLSGACLGVALGVKYSSLHFALALGPFALAFLARGASPTVSFKRSTLWLGCAAVLGSPWYVRNLILFSNPLFPFFNDVLGSRNSFPAEQSVLLRESFKGLANYSLSTGSPLMFLARVGAGFGPVPAALLLPGTLLALSGIRRGVGMLVAGTVASHLLLTLLIGFWEPRYILSSLVLASALAALAVSELAAAVGRRAGGLRRAAALVPMTAAVAALWTGYPGWRHHWQEVRAFRREGSHAFLEERVGYFAVAEWLNGHMGDHDRVAIGFNIQPFYYLERPYYHIHPLTEGDLVAARTPDEVETALRRVGATLLAFTSSDHTYTEELAPKTFAYRERLWLAQRRLRQAGRLQLLATIGDVRILRLVGASGN